MFNAPALHWEFHMVSTPITETDGINQPPPSDDRCHTSTATAFNRVMNANYSPQKGLGGSTRLKRESKGGEM